MTKKKSLTRLRLRGVAVCSFQRSEATNLDLYRQSSGFPGELDEGEAFLFLAKGMNQVIFIFREIQVGTEVSGYVEFCTVLDSRRLRMYDSTWHPHMLQEYAKAVGIHLVGIKSFGQIYEEQRLKKAQK